MRVLYFTRDYTPHDYRFLTALAENGQDVFFLRLERRGRQLEDRSLPPSITQLIWQGGQKPFEWRSLPALLPALRGVIQRVKPDVLHAGPIQTVAFMAALSGFRPLVTMSWGSDLLKEADQNRAYRWITRYTLGQSNVLVGDCQAVEDKAVSFGFPKECISIFPWGINLDQFSPANPQACAEGKELRARLGWQDQFVVLSLRSWEPIYGVDVMLKGFAQAAAQNPDLRLLLLGGGSQAKMVHQMIQQYDLSEKIHLGGQVNQVNLPHIYQAADLYVSASHSDGSSVSLMEALGSGLPVVVTDIPSNREWVTEGKQGWLFPDNNSEALTKAILSPVTDQQSLVDYRQAARQRAEERADWKKNFQVLLKGYEQAIALANHQEN